MTSTATNQDRVQEILDVLLQLAGAQLDARVALTGEQSPLELVAVAVNMLAEELAASMSDQARLRESLEREVAERNAQIQALEAAQELVSRQTESIRELSTPVMEIWTGILVLPLIGVVDEARGEQLMDQLLEAVAQRSARVVILDITGLADIDTMVAHQLLRVVSATGLLGAELILTGIGPHNAQTMVRLGVDLEGVRTVSTLKAGLEAALLLTRART